MYLADELKLINAYPYYIDLITFDRGILMSKKHTIKMVAAITTMLFASSVFAKDYTGLTTDYKKWANNNNFRDAGASLNTSCEFDAPDYNSSSKSSYTSADNNYTPYYYNPANDGLDTANKSKKHDELFKTNVLYRSNKNFSGGSCSAVGNPDVILDLEYDPSQKPTYCTDKNHNKVVAKVFNTSGNALHSIEALPFLPDQEKADTCNYIKEGIDDIAQGKSVLVHCSSGKDRTGAYVGLLTYLFAETKNLSGDDRSNMENGIMCDYLRSGKGIFGSRRAPSHYLLNYLQDTDLKYGSTSKLIINECSSVGVDISQDNIKRAADKFINK